MLANRYEKNVVRENEQKMDLSPILALTNDPLFAYRFDISLRQIPVQLSQVEKREPHANDIDDYPEDVEYVVTKRTMYQRTARCVVTAFRVRCQGSAEERRSQIDRYAGEPDHEGAEEHALRTMEGYSQGSFCKENSLSSRRLSPDFFMSQFVLHSLLATTSLFAICRNDTIFAQKNVLLIQLEL